MGWDEWVRGAEIEPSLYAADFRRLGEEVERMLEAGVRVFHFDIGDGHFVEPITVGPIVLQAIAPLVHEHGARLDCHLMVDNPERHIPQVARAGGDSVTFHVEVGDTAELISLAREHGLGAGVAFNPGTEPAEAARAAEAADLVLCMSIWPGYSGQAFIPETLERVRRLRVLLPDGVHVQVDGGVGSENAAALREAGANLLVAGSAVFSANDPTAAYRSLTAALT
ncbi:MAG: ribulose-phosphate 3-epimerase [Gaiellaceae bacterium]